MSIKEKIKTGWEWTKDKVKRFWKWMMLLLFIPLVFAAPSEISKQPIVEESFTYFAEIDKNDKVLRVIVADQAFIDSGKVGSPTNWVETTIDGSKRKNYAGIGYQYNKGLDAFIPPKIYNSWILDDQTARWKPPIAKPNDGRLYNWNEDIVNWELNKSIISPKLTE